MELIKITEKNGKQAVSARELHSFLEVGTRFNDWIHRMFEYGFSENVDFQVLLKNEYNQNGGRPETDFALSLDCAKEISMIQRSAKGKIARQYFIDCEKKLKNPVQSLSRIDLARMVIESEEENQRLQLEIKENAPLVVFAKALQISEHNILIGELAKILKQNQIEIGQNRLFDWLRDKGYLIKYGEQRNLPTQRSLELLLFEVKTTTINNPDGGVACIDHDLFFSFTDIVFDINTQKPKNKILKWQDHNDKSQYHISYRAYCNGARHTDENIFNF